MDILTVLDLAVDLEEQVALLYHGYSQRFHVNPSGFSFWEGVSREERRHADMVKTYRRQRLTLPLHRNEHPLLISDLERVTLEVRCELGLRPESICDALQTAYRIEQSLGHAHLDRLGEMGDPLVAKLLMKLGSEDHLQQERILRMSRIVSK